MPWCMSIISRNCPMTRGTDWMRLTSSCARSSSRFKFLVSSLMYSSCSEERREFALVQGPLSGSSRSSSLKQNPRPCARDDTSPSIAPLCTISSTTGGTLRWDPAFHTSSCCVHPLSRISFPQWQLGLPPESPSVEIHPCCYSSRHGATSTGTPRNRRST